MAISFYVEQPIVKKEFLNVICEAYWHEKPNHTPCRSPAIWILEITSTKEMIALCDWHCKQGEVEFPRRHDLDVKLHRINRCLF